MRILGIDTATTIASAALVDDGQIVAERSSLDCRSATPSPSPPSRGNHAETLLGLIESVLREGRTSLNELSGIAISIGPGSFTGLRVGLSTVKGLAYGGGIPVVGISTLLANAARVTDFQGWICSFFDAKKNEVYASLFQRNGNGLKRVTDDFVAPAEAAIERIKILSSPAPRMFIGDGAKTYERSLLSAFGKEARLSAGDSYHTIAASVGRLSIEPLRRSEVQELGACVPVYLSLSEAEVKRNVKL
jgi:tRNA threonylcarbamoyladenosine biosynthesis protein TsaB